jgi:hypothetical protein
MTRFDASILLVCLLAAAQPAAAQNSMHMQHMQQANPPPTTGMPQGGAQDSRELVGLPAPMQEHMLGNMRDHLVTLSEIIGHVADGKLDVAAKLSEQRLGMSSLSLHNAAHMAPFMPKPMQDVGTSMHRAASRLAITLQNAAVSPSLDAMAEVNRGLHEVTSACTACHASYRIR